MTLQIKVKKKSDLWTWEFAKYFSLLLDMKEKTLNWNLYQKRQNSEIWVILKLPKKFKTTFQTQIEMKMNFLIALMTRLNWDLTWHEAKWFRKTKNLKFGWLLKLPKISGICPKSQRYWPSSQRKIYLKRPNSEVLGTLKLPKKFKTTFQIQTKLNLTF